MHLKQEFRVEDPAAAVDLVRRHPLATIVAPTLRATHMPCLAEDGPTILSHVAKADPLAADLPGDLLLVFRGTCGYVSAGWYPTKDVIPTFDHVTLHVRGRAELLDDPWDVLCRTVAHFEARRDEPWRLEDMDGAEEMAREVVAFRVRPDSWHMEAKLHQDKDAELREGVVAGLEAPGPYANPELAAAIRSMAP